MREADGPSHAALRQPYRILDFIAGVEDRFVQGPTYGDFTKSCAKQREFELKRDQHIFRSSMVMGVAGGDERLLDRVQALSVKLDRPELATTAMQHSILLCIRWQLGLAYGEIDLVLKAPVTLEEDAFERFIESFPDDFVSSVNEVLLTPNQFAICKAGMLVEGGSDTRARDVFVLAFARHVIFTFASRPLHRPGVGLVLAPMPTDRDITDAVAAIAGQWTIKTVVKKKKTAASAD